MDQNCSISISIFVGDSKQPKKPILRLKVCYEEDNERFDPLR